MDPVVKKGIYAVIGATSFAYFSHLQIFKFKQEFSVEIESKIQSSIQEDLGHVKRELEVAKKEARMEWGQDIRAALCAFEGTISGARQKQLEDQDGSAEEEFSTVHRRIDQVWIRLFYIDSRISKLEQDQKDIFSELKKLNAKKE